MRPGKYIWKNFTLWYEVANATWATPLTDFVVFRRFYTPNFPKLMFQISGDSLHRLRSYFRESAPYLIRPTGTWVRLAVQNFNSIATRELECGPENI